MVRAPEAGFEIGRVCRRAFRSGSVFRRDEFLIEKLLIELGDPRLYDLIPWRYVFDTIDIGVVIVCGSLGIGEAVRVFRGHHD